MEAALLAFINLTTSDSIMTLSISRHQLEDFYRMFIDRYGLTIAKDDDGHPNRYRGLSGTVLSNMFLTERSFQCSLSGQLDVPSQRSFDLRFKIAMGSKGWPAQGFLGSDNIAQVATKTDSYGRTALHWAAEHFAYWTCPERYPLITSTDSVQLESYATLMMELITAGADVHAQSWDLYTPLTAIVHIDPMLMNPEWELARSVNRWGKLIRECNIALHDYASTENRLQRERSVPALEIAYQLHLTGMELLLLDDSTLALQIRCDRAVDVWEFRLPPGAWDTHHRESSSIFWHPSYTEVSQQLCFWETTREIRLPLAPCIMGLKEKLDRPFHNTSELNQHWGALFSSAQDDSGIVARARQLTDRRSRPSVSGRRRASSMPPTATLRDSESFPSSIPRCGRLEVKEPVSAHRCALDSKWKLQPEGPNAIDINCQLKCMQGLCCLSWGSRPEYINWKNWKYDLFDDRDQVDIALRYADRFQPELRSVIEGSHPHWREWEELFDRLRAQD